MSLGECLLLYGLSLMLVHTMSFTGTLLLSGPAGKEQSIAKDIQLASQGPPVTKEGLSVPAMARYSVMAQRGSADTQTAMLGGKVLPTLEPK